MSAKPTTAETIATAIEAANDGFPTKAAKKRALDDLSRAYEGLYRHTMSSILAQRNVARGDKAFDLPATKEETAEVDAPFDRDYWDLPSDLHRVRSRHLVIFAKYSGSHRLVRDLLTTRTAVKEVDVVTVARYNRLQQVRATILKSLEERKADWVRDLDVSHHFGMSVSVTAHSVRHESGTVYLRRFFYLHGRLTALGKIIAISETLDREEEAKA